MTEASAYEPDGGGDEIIAAEYVVGTLPTSERQQVSARIDSDPHFARVVDRWEGHFAPMHVVYQAVEPPASVKTAVDRRLFSDRAGVSASTATQRAGMWTSLAFWRGLTVAALAALVLYVAIPFIAAPPANAPQQMLIASIAPSNSNVAYLAMYDPAKGEVSLSHTSGDRGQDRDFELWMVEGGKAPVSMGVIPVGSSVHITIPPAAREKLAAGVALAVSREPLGGSPNGSPTEVVAAGGLTVI